jgi:hypothetical protein
MEKKSRKGRFLIAHRDGINGCAIITRSDLDVPWDLYEVPSERLVLMPPKDFDRFKPSGERAIQ